MNKSRILALKLSIMLWKRLRQKSRTTDKPDSRRLSTKLTMLKEKEGRDLKVRFRLLFHQRKKKKRFYRTSRKILRPIMMNRPCSRKEFQK
jgi:hypothetical protein